MSRLDTFRGRTQINANEILCAGACALNRPDLLIRAEIPVLQFSMPHIVGSDVAGEVFAIREAGQGGPNWGADSCHRFTYKKYRPKSARSPPSAAWTS
jgi:hypothetical protein